MGTTVANGTYLMDILTGLIRYLNAMGYASNFTISYYNDDNFTIGGRDVNGTGSAAWLGVNYTLHEKKLGK